MKAFPIPRFRDTILLICWIAGLVSICGLCWFLSGPLRADLLQRSINRAWISSGDSRRLETQIPPGSLKPNLERLGTWYTLAGGNRVLVFTIISDGIFLPCAAIINPRGKVIEMTPLGMNGRRLLSRAPSGIIQLYTRRIEGSYE